MRRTLTRLASLALVTLAFFRSDNLRITGSSADFGAPAGVIANNDNGNSSASISISAYNDTRPLGPNGRLCVFGAKGRLNNLIIQNLVAIRMARHLNRTLVVDPEVSKYYDVDRLSLAIYPDSPFRAAVASDAASVALHCCDPRVCSPNSIDHVNLNIEGRYDMFHEQTGELELAAVDNNDAWYWLGRPPEDVYDGFFRGLVPRPYYAAKVRAFLRERGLEEEEEDGYNALHLRHFEGRCGAFDADLCCPNLDHVRGILAERNASLSDPLFVANDGQCPEGVLFTYTNAPDTVIMGYDGECDGTECAVLDFELCVHSNVFVGNVKSSGDMNIREWRVARRDKGGWTSVLSRTEEAVRIEATHRHATRFFVGHWRWRPDCNAASPRQRAQGPCV